MIGRYRSPVNRRVAISLRLYGLSYEHRPITAWANRADIQAFNPAGRVPTLVRDDGEALYESAAILDFLDELVGPDRALTPSSGPARREALRLVGLALGVTKKTVAVVYEHSQRPEDKRHEPWIARCAEQAAKGLTALDGIAAKPWLTGEDMTQADVTAGVMYDFVRLTVPELLPLGRYQDLDRLAARCAELPAFAETQPESG